MEIIMTFLLIFLLVSLACFWICIPIMIANARGIVGGNKTAIVVLSWLGIFFGVTWIVALILSLIWNGETIIDGTSLDKLEKLSKLYKNKVITRAEYEEMKSKLI